MRPFTIASLTLTAIFFCRSATGAEPAASDHHARPNIVVILVDDLGFSDLGCYGGEIATPNIDKLAAGGLRFSQFYNCAKCETTRATLLSGLYHPEVGVGKLNHCMTIGEAMRRAGYRTLMSGKWHMAGEPTERGFDRYFGHLSGATDFFLGDNTFRLNGETFEVPKEGFYTTDAVTDYAMEFLRDAVTPQAAEAPSADQPFLLYLAYNAPHYPLQAPKEEIDKYFGKYMCGWDALRKQRRQRQIEMGLFARPWMLSPRPADVPAWDSLSPAEQKYEDFRMAVFAAMVDRLDQNIGRLLKQLDKIGAAENTLIMFLSDNGACPFERTRNMDKHKAWEGGSHLTYDKRWAGAGNTPFRWYKQNQHEGGISTPLVVHWPAGLKTAAGSVTHQPGHLIDIMATLLDVAGSDYPDAYRGRSLKPLRGKSLLPILQGEERDGHEALFFQFTNNRAVRQGDWKLVCARGGPWELYDMSVDRTELNNLAAQKPELVKELAAKWRAWAEEVGAH